MERRDHRIIAHAGGLSGQITQTALLPELGIGVGMFTNIEDGYSGQRRNAILDLAIAAPPFDWVAAAKRRRDEDDADVRKAAGSGDFSVPPGGPSLSITAYVGRYRDPWYGDIVVRHVGSRLTIGASVAIVPAQVTTATAIVIAVDAGVMARLLVGVVRWRLSPGNALAV